MNWEKVKLDDVLVLQEMEQVSNSQIVKVVFP